MLLGFVGVVWTFLDQGCGIKGFLPTSVIQGNPAFY